jgi:4a-hydroxytetrahydrobiopterin dehydratase
MPLPRDEVERRLPEGWAFDGECLRRTFSFATYRDGVAFAVKAALLAEEMHHHPDLTIGYRTVTVLLTTHSEGGVTEKDLTMAEKIGSLSP